MPEMPSSLSSENPPQLTINPPPMSPLLSPMMAIPLAPPPSPYPHQSAPFVGMMHQPQFMYNMLHGTLSSSGYHSSSGQMSNASLSLEHSRESSTYSSISSIGSNASPLGSPRNVSPQVFHEPASEKNGKQWRLTVPLFFYQCFCSSWRTVVDSFGNEQLQWVSWTSSG